MAALAAKAMGTVPVKEKQALLETRRQQTKKAKSILAGSSSRSVTSEQAGESRSLDGECVTWLDASSKEEGGLKRPDGAMDRSFGRLALQASSTFEGTEGDTYVESSLGTNYDGSSPSKFCIRQYTEIVRQDRGDLKQSWPLAEEYLRGRVLQGRVQVSLWPPIGGGESALTQAYKTQSSTPEGPLPHLFKLEIAFAESGLSEDKPDQSWLTSEEVGIEKRSGAQIIPSLDLLERRPLEEGACITRTKSFKSARRISPTVDCSGNGEAQERPKKDRRQRDTDAKQVEQLAPSQTGSLRSISRADAKDAGCVVERGGKQVQGDNGLIQLKDTGFVHTELGGVGLDTDKSKRFLDVTHPYASQERKTVDRSWKVQCSAENVADINDRVASTGKGKAAAANLGAEVEGWPLSTRSTTHIGDSGSDPKRGEKETGDVVAIEKETTVSKRRNEDDRVVEERSAKSDGASASRPSTKRQSNKSCPVCRSFSSMSQTTMNVHIDSCLVEHRQEEHVSDAEPVESELEPEREPNRSKILKSKAQGAKPKRKKRSIADIVANSSTRTLEESPGKEGARFIGPYSRSADQVHDSKNLNWVSGNKKKRQPRNVPSRNLNEENENKRRRLFRLESTTEESKPGKQEKRRLPEKERELTKLKQLRVERSSGPSTSISKSPKSDVSIVVGWLCITTGTVVSFHLGASTDLEVVHVISESNRFSELGSISHGVLLRWGKTARRCGIDITKVRLAVGNAVGPDQYATMSGLYPDIISAVSSYPLVIFLAGSVSDLTVGLVTMRTALVWRPPDFELLASKDRLWGVLGRDFLDARRSIRIAGQQNIPDAVLVKGVGGNRRISHSTEWERNMDGHMTICRSAPGKNPLAACRPLGSRTTVMRNLSR
ncbi:hypothetical protein AXG93_1175s1290 [Marchantia polymorpha subsp. ruderalis]|uniref:UBZ4-type domain-containing protein n=1 Tax=Marchantia polymorpha subsp. ruderalis TaxID=1480154 RepID=A0A176VMF5_MARPO|nr:hypothetical protein AXG93_1175s1290 [Marchantia polymorpha subsp. ruderalis]